jgi:hypothetical protein
MLDPPSASATIGIGLPFLSPATRNISLIKRRVAPLALTFAFTAATILWILSASDCGGTFSPRLSLGDKLCLVVAGGWVVVVRGITAQQELLEHSSDSSASLLPGFAPDPFRRLDLPALLSRIAAKFPPWNNL